jgi:hypothetical protein
MSRRGGFESALCSSVPYFRTFDQGVCAIIEFLSEHRRRINALAAGVPRLASHELGALNRR